MPSLKTVLVHRCYNQQIEMLPEKCRCAWFVTPKHAGQMVEGGMAIWVMLKNSRGFPMPSYMIHKPQIVTTRRKPTLDCPTSKGIGPKAIMAMAGIHDCYFPKALITKRSKMGKFGSPNSGSVTTERGWTNGHIDQWPSDARKHADAYALADRHCMERLMQNAKRAKAKAKLGAVTRPREAMGSPSA